MCCVVASTPRLSGRRIAVVIEFESESELTIITAWRKR
jgi:hypothetical protein